MTVREPGEESAAARARAEWQSTYQSRVTNEQTENHAARTAAFRALENVDAYLSPQVTRSVQATINRIRQIGRDYGLLTEDAVRSEMGLKLDESLPRLFSVTYRDEKLYPAFLFEPVLDENKNTIVRPVVAQIAKLADEGGWNDSSVVFWFVTPTGYLPPGEAPVDHFHDPVRLLTIFESYASVPW